MKTKVKSSEEYVRLEAYLLSENAGHPHGMEAVFWAQAETIVQARQAGLTIPKKVAAKKAAAPKKPAPKTSAAKKKTVPTTTTALKAGVAKKSVRLAVATKPKQKGTNGQETFPR